MEICTPPVLPDTQNGWMVIDPGHRLSQLHPSIAIRDCRASPIIQSQKGRLTTYDCDYRANIRAV